MTFTKEEILEFVDDVHDENPIHRCESYIVHGCLLLEALYNQYHLKFINFLNPVLAGDTVRINAESSKVTCTVGDIIVCEGK